MNALQIFNYQDGAKLVLKNNNPAYVIINNEKYDKFRLLAMASELGHINEKQAWKLMNTISKLFHAQDDPTFNELYGAVAIKITMDNSTNENDLHSKFNKAVKKIMGNSAEVITRKNSPRHQPDSWVRLNNKEMPVEMKLGVFDGKALRQLNRYIDFYGCEFGIAVGKKMTVDKPGNITFISIDDLGGVR